MHDDVAGGGAVASHRDLVGFGQHQLAGDVLGLILLGADRDAASERRVEACRA
jgi:hypothetical protein